LSSPSCQLPQLVFHCYSHISFVVFIVYNHFFITIWGYSKCPQCWLCWLVFKISTKLIFPIMSLAQNILGFNVPFWNMFRMFVTITFAISTNTIRTC
jgi:hypothetical protein